MGRHHPPAAVAECCTGRYTKGAPQPPMQPVVREAKSLRPLLFSEHNGCEGVSMPLGNVLQALMILAVVLVGSVLVGNLFRRIHQPAVVGVIFFGLLVGTALAVRPHSVKAVLLSSTSKSLIEAVGQTGLLLLLFLVGIELRSYSKTTTERSPLWRLLPCVL